MTLTDVYCEFKGDLILKKNDDETYTNITCNSSYYNQSNNELTCQMVNPYISFSEHFLFYNDINLTGNEIFISNSLNESNWEVSGRNSVSDSYEIITLTNFNKDFYMPTIKNLSYYYFNKSNEINYITEFKNENYAIEFKIENIGANYYIIIDKLYREKHKDDDNNSLTDYLLYHQFDYMYYHILYTLEKNFIFYTGNDGDIFNYKINLTFSNNESSTKFQNKIQFDKIDNEECEKIENFDKVITCNLSIEINSSYAEVKKEVSINNFDYSDYSLYEIYYNLNAICINEKNNNDNYTLYFISHQDLGNINLKFNEINFHGISKN